MKDNKVKKEPRRLTKDEAHSKNHVGTIVDKFWTMIPRDHSAFKSNPLSMPSPHDHLLLLGKKVVELCEAKGCFFEDRLKKENDHNAWMRLLGAWVLYSKRFTDAGTKMPSRSEISQKTGIGASSLTNFLNARRGITLKGLKTLSDFLGVKPLDIRPELGASEICSNNRIIMKNMATISHGLDELSTDIEAMRNNENDLEIAMIINKIGLIKDVILKS